MMPRSRSRSRTTASPSKETLSRSKPTFIVGEEIKITLAEPASGVVIKKKRGKAGDTDLPKAGAQF
jgi:hypothetical protein